ncbi:sulfotransferase [Methylophaga nitratireducenticrescens]|uniref:sulfotransferase n=1 Tax=Methylophaga nitratireducenticrescens TaxID=754476 RepID=UPI00125F44C7|nr:sulfotransferase [Methylophaga nitratireducenticrescens]
MIGNNQKIFCIGLNKTGTTSIKKAMQHLGFIVGNQAEAQNLLKPWLKRDFQPIINYCKYAQAFQDSPFSFPYTYIPLDQAFPNSKFILTIRDDAEQWYSSITRFHGKKWSNGAIPTKNDLLNAVNGTKGRPWIVNRALFCTPEEDPYQKEKLIAFYNNYIHDVKQYFKYRTEDLLIINVANEDSYLKFCEFLGKSPIEKRFPWENKT